MPQQNKFDVDAARKAGHSDDEIIQYLAGTNGFDVAGALKAGHSKSDIIAYLSGTSPQGGAIPGAPEGLPDVPSARRQALKQAPLGGLPDDRDKGRNPPPPDDVLPKMEPSFWGGAAMTPQQSKFVSEKAPGAIKEMNKLRWEGVGAAAGGEAGAMAGLGRLGRAVLVGAGTTAGSMTGDITNREKPKVKEALVKGAVTGAGGYALDLGIDAAANLIRPFLQKAPLAASEEAIASQVSKRASDLTKMADAEEGIRQSIVAAPKAIREQVINKVYPQIEGPVDVGATAQRTLETQARQVAHSNPGVMNRTMALARKINRVQKAVDSILAEGGDFGLGADEQAALETGMDKLSKLQSMTFMQAKQLRNALGRIRAAGEGYKLPGETIQAVKDVMSTLDEAIDDTAAREGKLDQLRMADKVYKQFMDDFYNHGAPLKGVGRLKPEMTGKTLDTLLKPENSQRAVAALKRWGMSEQADALQTIADRADRADAVSEMKDLFVSESSYRSRAAGALKQQEAARVDAAVKALREAREKRLKYAAGAVGIGSSIAALQRLMNAGKPGARGSRQ